MCFLNFDCLLVFRNIYVDFFHFPLTSQIFFFNCMILYDIVAKLQDGFL